MAFSGQLNDLALSELIEFFCNQRKTGRLKVDYALAPGVFFIKDGDLVDAKVGALNGPDAVFFALTLPSASFDFNAGMLSSRRTINESWASVVLEGLRRLDEGIMPDASQAFASEEEIDEATIDYLNCIKNTKEDAPAAKQAASKNADAAKDSNAPDDSFPLPLSQTLEATNNGGSKKKFVVAAVAAALVLACVVVAVPLSKRFARPPASAGSAAPAASQPTSGAADAPDNSASDAAAATPAASIDPSATAATDAAASEAAALAARREREARLERQRKLEAKRDAAQASTEASAPEVAAPKPVAVGPKSVRVSVSYDEAGRVTQTSVVGSSPGAEAYASTAVRVARGRRFPAGKAGSAVVTIPIN